MNNKQLYGQEFYSKKDLLNWLEKNADKIDWDYSTVTLEWYWKEDE
jgi:hypothetical protein